MNAVKRKNKSKIEIHFVKSKAFLLLIVLFIFVLVLTFFFGDSGLVEIIKAQDKIQVLKTHISHLQDEKQQLKEEITALEKNPLALEKTAREKLWLMKSNERVIVIVDEREKEKKGQASTGKKK